MTDTLTPYQRSLAHFDTAQVGDLLRCEVGPLGLATAADGTVSRVVDVVDVRVTARTTHNLSARPVIVGTVLGVRPTDRHNMIGATVSIGRGDVEVSSWRIVRHGDDTVSPADLDAVDDGA